MQPPKAKAESRDFVPDATVYRWPAPMRQFAPHATVVLGSHATPYSGTRVACDTLPPRDALAGSLQSPMQPPQGDEMGPTKRCDTLPRVRQFTRHPCDTLPPMRQLYSGRMRHFAPLSTPEGESVRQFTRRRSGPCDTLPSMRHFTRHPCDTLPPMRHFSRRALRACDSFPRGMRHFTPHATVYSAPMRQFAIHATPESAPMRQFAIHATLYSGGESPRKRPRESGPGSRTGGGMGGSVATWYPTS